jgi:hypothetical protein
MVILVPALDGQIRYEPGVGAFPGPDLRPNSQWETPQLVQSGKGLGRYEITGFDRVDKILFCRSLDRDLLTPVVGGGGKFPVPRNSTIYGARERGNQSHPSPRPGLIRLGFA